MIKGVMLLAFQDHVRTIMENHIDADNSEVIQHAILKVAHKMRKDRGTGCKRFWRRDIPTSKHLRPQPNLIRMAVRSPDKKAMVKVPLFAKVEQPTEQNPHSRVNVTPVERGDTNRLAIPFFKHLMVRARV